MNKHFASALAGCALLALTATPVGAAGNRSSDQENAASSADNMPVTLQRADHLLGLDVMSSDGKKVGDIVDFAFRFDDSPRISHVLVMTGGFLDMGGDVRAIPAEAFTLAQDTARLNHDRDTFEGAPLITQDREAMFNDEARLQENDQYFSSLDNESNDNDAQSQANAGTERSSSASAKQSFDNASYLTYGAILDNEVVGSDGVDLGRVVSVWVDLDSNRAPLVEIDQSAQVGNRFEARSGLRYELPAAKFDRWGEDGEELHFQLTGSDLSAAPSVSSLDNVSLDVGIGSLKSVLKLDGPEGQRDSQKPAQSAEDR